MTEQTETTAYLSMEFAISDKIPNYAGGLGVLAADLMLSACDLKLPVVGVTLLYHQNDDPKLAFPAEKHFHKCKPTITVQIENRKVKLIIWKKTLHCTNRGAVPVYFLSSYHPDNQPWDRDLTKNLYPGHAYTRLGQETILGIGAIKALRELGYDVRHYHMNEGHSALAALKRLQELNKDREAVRQEFSFTTHTPVSSGHDYFDYELANNMISRYLPENIREIAGTDSLGMTELAMRLSRHSNSVSLKHKEVCETMFPKQTFENITNGIYHPRWVGQHIKTLLDDQLPGWQENPDNLDRAIHEITDKDVLQAKQKQKKELIEWLNSHQEYLAVNAPTDENLFDKKCLTIGFARRMVPYKRTALIFRDLKRLRETAGKKIQLVFAGNVYENDTYSQEVFARIKQAKEELRDDIKIAFIPYYNLAVAKRLTQGCDIWLNNPVPGREASGTSGMKAALNAGLNLSAMDGWWIEAFRSDPKSGWAFGEYQDKPDRDESDFTQLLACLSEAINCFYNRPEEWAERMKRSIALISFFNTHRAIQEYTSKLWNNSI
jgi:starch phosphorylase